MSGGARRIRLRALLLRGGRRLATSRIRRVRLRARAAEAPQRGGRAYWGAWIGDQLTGTGAPWDMSALSAFQEMVGKAPSIVEFSGPFASCAPHGCADYGFPTGAFTAIREAGAIPLLSWGSESLPPGATQPDFQLADLLSGRYDRYIRSFASQARSWGHPFFLRFDWEMNGNWFPWGEGVNDNRPGEFARAWRHVHDIFRAVGATNATWVWCPYVGWDAHLASLYPGDRYVDWTCLDGYNWGPKASMSFRWTNFSGLFDRAYREVAQRIAPTKPMMIAEIASTERGGSKATWITQMFHSLPTEFPRIRGLVWFETYGNDMDWPLESSTSATEAFAAGISSNRYAGNDYGNLSATPIPPP